MGTSHRHKLGVAGQPNWGSVSSSITGVANGVVESDMLDNNPPANMTPQQKSKRQSIIGSRISNNYHHAVRNLLRASGGRAWLVFCHRFTDIQEDLLPFIFR